MYTKYSAKAIGSGAEAAQADLDKQYKKDMTLKDAQILTLSILKQVMEEKLDKNNVQLAQVKSYPEAVLLITHSHIDHEGWFQDSLL